MRRRFAAVLPLLLTGAACLSLAAQDQPPRPAPKSDPGVAADGQDSGKAAPGPVFRRIKLGPGIAPVNIGLANERSVPLAGRVAILDQDRHPLKPNPVRLDRHGAHARLEQGEYYLAFLPDHGRLDVYLGLYHGDGDNASADYEFVVTADKDGNPRLAARKEPQGQPRIKPNDKASDQDLWWELP
jgi:hypothetical protein